MASNIERAKGIINTRRENAELEAEKKRLELETVSPELCEVNAKIARTGLDALKVITMGQGSKDFVDALAKQNFELQAKRGEILRSLGLSEDALAPHYTCSVCEDKGVVDGHYCDCLKALVRQLQFDNLCSCAPAKASTFENFDLGYYSGEALARMTQIYNYCKSWAADFDKDTNSILMCGQTGLGKTHLSLAIANVVVGKGYNVIYSSASNLLSQLEKEKFGRYTGEDSPEELALSCDLLILDDLGTEYTRDFERAAIYNIVNTRLLSALPTIINTNLLYDEIAEKYDKRVYSRLIGNYQPLEFLGEDVRQKMNKI
ncbi:MAG: ATP-binding protein [Clostridia bacterium]|nr:ATP-binding protein [Clostridia bacterium]